MNPRILLAIGLLAGLCGSASAQVVTVKKDGTGTYMGIQEAIDDGGRTETEIVVYPGIYQENISIPDAELTLRAIDGPLMTVIDGVLAQGGQMDTVVINPAIAANHIVTIIGFTITRGYNGIYVHDLTQSLIANCVIHENSGDGIVLENIYNIVGTVSATIHNNVFLANTGNGINFSSPQIPQVLAFPMSIKNNIIYLNGGHGFVATHSGGQPVDSADVDDGDLIDYDYNANKANTLTSYGSQIGTSGANAIQVGTHNNTTIFFQPRFIGEASGYGYDVRLSRNPNNPSDAIDAGQESGAAKDPDGSRNDMGAFGGPFAATFFEGPEDGPIVTSVVVTPANVPQGVDFSISATVSVR